MPREVVSIHIGQCGVRVGDECWELFAREHGILPDGTRPLPSVAHGVGGGENNAFASFFAEDGKRHVPRAVFVDLEPSAVDGVRAGPNRGLVRTDFVVAGKEDACSSYGRALTVGREVADEAMDKIRRLADDCDGLQGFLIFHAAGGGTGSGFTSLVLERLAVDYGKKDKTALSVFPSPRVATSVVEPYNTALVTHALIELTDVGVVLDNEAIYDVCKRSLGLGGPSYANLNRVIAQAVSSLTAPLRFGGDLNADLREMHTNLVPFPRVHFVIPALAPMASRFAARFQQFTTPQITSAVFDPANFLVKCDPRGPKHCYLATCLLYRGDVVVKDVNASVAAIKSKPWVRFAAWKPTGFKQGIAWRQAAVPEGSDMAPSARSVLNVCNNTAVSTVFGTTASKFDLLYAKRAFLYWFVLEAMEDGEFAESRENLAALLKDYEELGANSSSS